MSCYCGEKDTCATVQTITRPHNPMTLFVQECHRQFETNPEKGMPLDPEKPEGEMQPPVLPVTPVADAATQAKLDAQAARIAELESLLGPGDETTAKPPNRPTPK